MTNSELVKLQKEWIMNKSKMKKWRIVFLKDRFVDRTIESEIVRIGVNSITFFNKSNVLGENEKLVAMYNMNEVFSVTKVIEDGEEGSKEEA